MQNPSIKHTKNLKLKKLDFRNHLEWVTTLGCIEAGSGQQVSHGYAGQL